MMICVLSALLAMLFWHYGWLPGGQTSQCLLLWLEVSPSFFVVSPVFEGNVPVVQKLIMATPSSQQRFGQSKAVDHNANQQLAKGSTAVICYDHRDSKNDLTCDASAAFLHFA